VVFEAQGNAAGAVGNKDEAVTGDAEAYDGLIAAVYVTGNS
jgi:hypothetical protein